MRLSRCYGVRGASWGVKHVCDALTCLERPGGRSVRGDGLVRRGEEEKERSVEDTRSDDDGRRTRTGRTP